MKQFSRMYKFIPNITTLSSVCCGLASIKCAFISEWTSAVMFIVIASMIDCLDGRIARMFRSVTEFGAQLDSLADFLNFGVAPALLMYFWSLHSIEFGWSLTTFFVICIILRLARFNTTQNTLNKDSSSTENKKSSKFFSGLASPAGSILLMAPIVISLDPFLYELLQKYITNTNIAINTFITSILLMCKIPTFSIKYISQKLLIFLALTFTAMLFIKPWATIFTLTILYVSSIPVILLIKACKK